MPNTSIMGINAGKLKNYNWKKISLVLVSMVETCNSDETVYNDTMGMEWFIKNT